MRLGLAAGALPLVHIRGAKAAGSLKLGFWDHWVPGGNVIMKKQIDGWAAKNHVAVEVDFIGGTANQLQTVAAAEAEAKFGHDIMTFITWDVHNHAPTLEPIDDVMKELTAKNGAVNDVCHRISRKCKDIGPRYPPAPAPRPNRLRAYQRLQEGTRPRSAGHVSG